MSKTKSLNINGSQYDVAWADDTQVGASTWSSQKIVDELNKTTSVIDDYSSIICKDSGENIIINDASDRALRGLSVYGKTIQSPSGKNLSISPEYPQELKNSGSDGNIIVSVTGKNLYNSAAYPLTSGLWLNKGNASTGSDSAYAMTLDYIPIDSYVGQTITLNHIPGGTNPGMCFYDANKTFISGAKGNAVVIPENAAFMRFTVPVAYADGSDVQIEIGSTATAYEPYKAPQTMSISTPGGLPGIPVASGGNYTDSAGQQWICDEIDFERGMYVKRVDKKYLNGSEAWVDRGETITTRWLLGWNIGFENYAGGIPRLLCDKYQPIDTNDTWNNYATLLSFGMVGGSLCIKNQNFTSLDAWKAELKANPIELLGVLATPIETPLPADQIAAYKSLHTNKNTTFISNDEGAYMEVRYTADIRAYLNNKLNELSTAIVNNT